jgi:hypothetical protein
MPANCNGIWQFQTPRLPAKVLGPIL